MADYPERPSTEHPPSRAWVRSLALGVAAAVLLYGLAAWQAGAQATAEALVHLGPLTLLTGAAVASLNLLIRFLRWQGLLHAIGRPPGLRWVRSLVIYLAGLALTASPGKLGETVRSLFLHQHGVPWPRSLGAFFVDRGSDVIGVALLGAGAAWILGHRAWPLEALAVGSAVGSGAAAWAWRRWAASPRPGLGRWLDRRWSEPLTVWASLWHPRRVAWCTVLAMLAYGAQALVLAAFVHLLHPGIPVVACVLIFAQAVLWGAASLIPGGLGATEAALVWQLHDRGVPWPQAVACAVALRACTLWTATAVGVVCLTVIGRPVKTPRAQ